MGFSSKSYKVRDPVTVQSNEPVREKTNNLGSEQVQHKPACIVTEDDLRLEIMDLERKGIVLSV